MRKTFVMVAALLLVMAFTGATQAATTITWWTWEPPEVIAKYQPMLDKFQAENDIQLEIVQVGWAEMKERLVVAIAGGVAPDVAMVSSRWADSVAEQGAFADLTERFNNDPSCKDFFPAVVNLWTTTTGEIYGLAGDLDLPALFYNREFFDQEGIDYPEDIDWNDLLDISRKMTKDLDGDGLNDQFGFTNWWYVWITMIWANGGDFLNEDRTDIALNTPEARQTIEFFKELNQYQPTSADWSRLGFPHAAALWKGGKAAMAPAGAWMPNYWIFDKERNDYMFDFDVAHMPKSFIGERATPIEGSAHVILATSTKQDAAWKFIKFITGEEFLMANALQGFPSRRSVAEVAFNQPNQKPESKAVLMEVVEYARPFPKGVDWWGSIYPKIMAGLGRYLAGEEGLDAVLENISREVKPILAEMKK